MSCRLGCAQAGLVQTDRLYSAKRQLVEAMGFSTVQVGERRALAPRVATHRAISSLSLLLLCMRWHDEAP